MPKEPPLQTLKEFRDDKGLSQRALAAKIDTTQTLISMYETGKAPVPEETKEAFRKNFHGYMVAEMMSDHDIPKGETMEQEVIMDIIAPAEGSRDDLELKIECAESRCQELEAQKAELEKAIQNLYKKYETESRRSYALSSAIVALVEKYND